ncbi:hypothetical protein A2703_03475 [Candidatus Collierbacteria bacterium RIFCSPHIGHO2_01_FULL_50_25]|uniref:Glycosyltransferase RgtA/B/C/D-like domain-containing protein n=1 Tax=Candidatus Collierbacteria bacterium RIFCSPHIGHO2_01_FULL_50_25 TaxID=1817722 RepID=A0A1F5EX39_9BACT|nr:MAG: hypothetical protein A2703_03475 [Candidatus Collierbacteria bacterium RIFCSPHIGHO2_01_FULL_50_25]
MKYRHLFIFLFLFLWVFLGFYLSRVESPTFDEPVHYQAGLLYLKEDYRFDPIEPPLLRRVVFTLGKQIEKLTGPTLTLFPYRAVVVIGTGVALSLLLWPLFTRSLFSGLLASVLFVYEPSLIAHSHYFTTDAFSAIISVIVSLLILSESWKTRGQFLLLLVAVSLASATKVATLALILPLLLIKLRSLGKRNAILLLVFPLLFIWVTYGFRSEIIFNRFPTNVPFGGYLRAIKENILLARRGQPIFFAGELFREAPPAKTLAVLFLKTTLPLLIFVFWSLKKAKGNGKYLLIFLVVLLVGLFKPLNFGMRHLLPAVIVLILIAASVKPKTIVNWMVFTLLILWQITAFKNSLPQTITYTNELSGKPYRIFTDSDYDWGQGLLWLREEISRRNITDYQLAYFGNIDPLLFLGKYNRIKDENPAGSLPVQKLNYAKPIIISVTCYYLCGYYQDPLLAAYPKTLIAQSFFIFP